MEDDSTEKERESRVKSIELNRAELTGILISRKIVAEK